MFFYRSKSWAPRLICACLALTISTSVFASEEETNAISERAKEIAASLPDAPSFGARAAGRAIWEEWASSGRGANVLKTAEDLLKQPIPDLSETLYKEYYRNGNRSNYQSAFFKTTSRVNVFALAETLENKGRFVKPLEETLEFLCEWPSWVLPAHDSNATVYDQKGMWSDLGSTLTGGEIAIAVNLLEDKLNPELVARVKAELERRILAPYEKSLKDARMQGMWWVRTTNNWSAVCHNGTVATALNVVDSKERRALFVAGAEYFSERYFMKGFTNDGYCSEGMGYWDYGYGNYIEMGARVRVETQGAVDFFRFPGTQAVLSYAPTLEIDKNNFAVFADCSPTARPSALYVGYLSRLKNYGYVDYESRGLGKNFGIGSLITATSFGYDQEITFAEENASAEKFVLPIRTDFPDAGVLICRPAKDAKGKYFAAAFKGGHNNEMHNHNDVGSYSLILGTNAKDASQAVYVSRDPGGETYTARTFSGRRYEGQLLNSFGHPVPMIAGKLQSTGAKARGVVVEKNLTDELDKFEIDLTSAYAVPTLQSIRRAFEYKRASGDDPGYFEIRDVVAFKEGATEDFETALVSFEKPEAIEIEATENGGVNVKLSGAVVRVDAKNASGETIKLVAEKQIVGENDASVPRKPTRVALRVEGKTNAATITQRFEVQN